MAEQRTEEPNAAVSQAINQSASTQNAKVISQQDLSSALSSIAGEKYKFNEELLTMLRDMGFSENLSKRALYYTGGLSIEAAVEWVDDNIEDPDLDTPFVPLSQPPRYLQQQHADPRDPGYEADEEPEFKMLFVVNGDLKMGAGKMAAQVAHAALGLYHYLQSGSVRLVSNLATWEVCGGRKVVVGGKDAQELSTLYAQALGKGIPHHQVKDAGRTQVPAGSVTVLALFGSDEELEPVTGHLKLL